MTVVLPGVCALKSPAAPIALFLPVVQAHAHSPVLDIAPKPADAPFLIDESPSIRRRSSPSFRARRITT
jgi:hypothetical protein